LSVLFYHVFGRFTVRKVQKHPQKIHKKSDPGPFLASDPPAHHGGHRLSFWILDFGGRAPLCQWHYR
jgi:hypothetical protein